MHTKPTGPGPGAFVVPSTVGYLKHDLRKPRRPQYSFGMRLNNLFRSVGPGPGAYNVEAVTRYGNNGAPKHSIGQKLRNKEICNNFSPGPGTHDVHLKPFFKGTNAPAYSLRPRDYREQCIKFVPAPNVYMVKVELTKPSPPAYPMGIKLGTKPTITSPGPATYAQADMNAVLRKNPVYSMRWPNQYPFKASSPGANTYNLAHYTPGTKRPAYSFGIRHNMYSPPLVVACDNL